MHELFFACLVKFIVFRSKLFFVVANRSMWPLRERAFKKHQYDLQLKSQRNFKKSAHFYIAEMATLIRALFPQPATARFKEHCNLSEMTPRSYARLVLHKCETYTFIVVMLVIFFVLLLFFV